eukprot:TRINITY_DN2345_c0_g1_i4.p1 TRINITY_DN2345_c0_g1~~TRINITY_DN2345_c0_g1_i4.p1  ORF type:complete len:323 (+),score=92.96 TRINITY_DN2345_c0_g1_i4:927-1895(+)
MEPHLYTYMNDVEFLDFKEADAVVRQNLQNEVTAEKKRFEEELKKSVEEVEQKLARSRESETSKDEGKKENEIEKELVVDLKSSQNTLEDAKAARQVRKLLKELRERTSATSSGTQDDDEEDDEEDDDMDPDAPQRGLDKRPFHQKPLEELFPHREILKIGSHTVVTKGGRINSISCLSIIGDGNGTVGLGYGKAAQQEQAVKNSMRDAMKNIVFLPRFEGRTITGSHEVKYGATKVLLKGGPEGYGIRAKHKWYPLIRLFGYQDLMFKIIKGRKNKANMIKAMIKGFGKSVNPSDIQRATGKKLFCHNDIVRQQKNIKYTF